MAADTAAGPAVGAAVGAKIDSALRHLPRDVPAAHADLEAIRALLRDARARHGARTVDDAVTDYHEAVERSVESHRTVERNRADREGLHGDRRGCRRRAVHLGPVESFPELAQPPAGWSDAAAATTSVLGAIAEAAGRRDAATVQQASQILKSRYFDLLSVLSHRQ